MTEAERIARLEQELADARMVIALLVAALPPSAMLDGRLLTAVALVLADVS